jgi:hypothetical protein
MAALFLGIGLAALGGCQHSFQEKYYNCVDPCWPERYDAMAAGSVNQAFAAQVYNGHVLDQTVWNDFFCEGSAALTPYGITHLDYIARRRPQPDPHVFLQTSLDVPFVADHPELFVKQQADLNAMRAQSVMNYLKARTAARPVAWTVTVHDPNPVGLPGILPVWPLPNYQLKSIQDRGTFWLGQMPTYGTMGANIGGGGLGR